jgi:hypothetical protein
VGARVPRRSRSTSPYLNTVLTHAAAVHGDSRTSTEQVKLARAALVSTRPCRQSRPSAIAVPTQDELDHLTAFLDGNPKPQAFPPDALCPLRGRDRDA